MIPPSEYENGEGGEWTRYDPQNSALFPNEAFFFQVTDGLTNLVMAYVPVLGCVHSVAPPSGDQTLNMLAFWGNSLSKP